LSTNHCELVLIDLLLRQGSGFGVLKRLQSMRDGSAQALRIVITNQATPEVRRRCQELGATAVFDKSRELEELFDFLRTRQEAPS
jgi:DNA-binding NarL/FixJ family response regulator